MSSWSPTAVSSRGWTPSRKPDSRRVTVRRIGEPIQDDHDLMASLSRAGVMPGQVVKVRRTDSGVLVGSGMEYAELDMVMASHVFVADG